MSEHPNPQLHDQILQAIENDTLESVLKNYSGGSWVARGDSEAQVNWDTTVALLGPSKATEWFAGPSVTRNGSPLWPNSPDDIRDTKSQGNLWEPDRPEIKANIETISTYFVEQAARKLIVEVFNGHKLVLLYEGTRVSGVATGRRFNGRGLFAIVI